MNYGSRIYGLRLIYKLATYWPYRCSDINIDFELESLNDLLTQKGRKFYKTTIVVRKPNLSTWSLQYLCSCDEDENEEGEDEDSYDKLGAEMASYLQEQMSSDRSGGGDMSSGLSTLFLSLQTLKQHSHFQL